MPSLKLKSPAKLNLYLRIINKRTDGYHDIVTLFERIDLFDEITIRKGTARRAPTIKITCSNPKIPTGPKNLVYKAAKALLDYTGKRFSCHIAIKKRIPAAAGLGGGSSNAATTLIGLNRLWKLGLNKKELLNLGAKIGADVNFFLSGSSLAIGTGRGEVTSPLHLKRPLWHVIIYPGKGLSTKDIYDYWDNMYNRAKFGLTAALADVKILLHSIRSNDLTLLAKNLHNDLEEPAAVKDDTIFKAKGVLSSCKAKGVLMSGSGSAVFGIAPSRKEATRIRQEASRLNRGWQVFVARTH